MTWLDKLRDKVLLRRSLVLGMLILVLWLARSLMSTILLTFIFAFLVVRLVRFIQRYVHVKPVVIVAPLYILIVGALYFVATRYIPLIGHQSVKLFESVLDFYNSSAFDHNATIQWGVKQINELNLTAQLKVGVATIVQYVSSLGGILMTTFLALVLSFFYSIELDGVNEFGKSFLNSPFGWFFEDLRYFADKFTNTFGVVMEAQIVIALVNTFITVITLIALHMPNIPSLGIMVFLLSLVPVAGAVVSVIPLAIIAYTVGGLRDVVTIVLMILVIHALEAYVLNPKFMSSRTKLPIFFTFVVLLVAEHMWGTWGLIVGIPVFTFLLDVFGIKEIGGGKKKPRLTKAEKRKLDEAAALDQDAPSE